jgi:hypothetical protein
VYQEFNEIEIVDVVLFIHLFFAFFVALSLEEFEDAKEVI